MENDFSDLFIHINLLTEEAKNGDEEILYVLKDYSKRLMDINNSTKLSIIKYRIEAFLLEQKYSLLVSYLIEDEMYQKLNFYLKKDTKTILKLVKDAQIIINNNIHNNNYDNLNNCIEIVYELSCLLDYISSYIDDILYLESRSLRNDKTKINVDRKKILIDINNVRESVKVLKNEKI